MQKVMLVGVLALLAACSNGKGLLSKTLPDETRVIDGPTLALPPQFELRPPREASDYETVLRAQKGLEARSLITTGTSATVVGSEAEPAADVPAGDAWLVDKTQAQTGVVADPSVREQLDKPSSEEVQAEEAAKAKKGLLGRWFGRSDD